jgi:hypothetical protein
MSSSALVHVRTGLSYVAFGGLAFLVPVPLLNTRARARTPHACERETGERGERGGFWGFERVKVSERASLFSKETLWETSLIDIQVLTFIRWGWGSWQGKITLNSVRDMSREVVVNKYCEEMAPRCSPHLHPPPFQWCLYCLSAFIPGSSAHKDFV